MTVRWSALVLVWMATGAALVAAVVVAGRMEFAGIRDRTEVMLALITVVGLAAQLPFSRLAVDGFTGRLVRAAVVCVAALDGLATAQVLRDVPPIRFPDGAPRTGDATVVLAVWSVLLALFIVAAVRVTARRAGVPSGLPGRAAVCGFAAAALWLGLTWLVPWLAATLVPALFAMIGAGAVAAQLTVRVARLAGRSGGDRSALAALFAATIAGIVIVVAIDGLLPLSHLWVRNSAPPWATGARLVDPVGLLMVGALLAVGTAVAARRPRPAAAYPGSAGLTSS